MREGIHAMSHVPIVGTLLGGVAGGVGQLFKGMKTPKLPTPQSAPTAPMSNPADMEAQTIAAQSASFANAGQGYASTILSGDDDETKVKKQSASARLMSYGA